MNKYYPDNIMQDLRQRRGLKADDTSEDIEILKMNKSKVLNEIATWNGLINYGDVIIKWIEQIYNIELYQRDESKDNISVYDFSARVYNALYRTNIFTFSQLENYTEEDLLKIKNLSKNSINEIKTALNSMNMKLKKSSSKG